MEIFKKTDLRKPNISELNFNYSILEISKFQKCKVKVKSVECIRLYHMMFLQKL